LEVAQSTQDGTAQTWLEEAWTCCPLCDVWYPLDGPLNYFLHLLHVHADTRAAQVVAQWLDDADQRNGVLT
jgi:hypothetical protein